MVGIIQPFVDAMLEFVYPRACVCCNDELTLDETSICQSCEETLTHIQPPICLTCGSPVLEEHVEQCINCFKGKMYFDQVRSALDYNDDHVRQMIHTFKFDFIESIVDDLSAFLQEAFQSYYSHESVDFVMSVPLHKSRLRHREFNQSHLLAKQFAEDIHIPLRDDIVIRHKNTKAQSQLKPEERHKNIQGAFIVIKPEDVINKTILIIDDIVTTGSTANEMSKVLRENGASRIMILSLARAYTQNILQ